MNQREESMVGGDAKFPLKESRFLEWYFSDFDEVRDLGYQAMFRLRAEGVFTITSQDLLDGCPQVPSYLFEGLDPNQEDISNEQITLIK